MLARILRPLSVLALALAELACGGGPVTFQVERAPEYSRGTVSVFGLYKDGRMSPESWDSFGPKLVARDRCDPVYSAALIAKNPGLAAAVDDYVRANGVSDRLLDQFGPAAGGDSIMVVTVAGHPPRKTGTAWVDPPPRSPGMQTKPATMGGYHAVTDGSVLEVSASFFSVRHHRFVGIVTMTYSGQDTDEALRQFAEKLAAEMPVTACSAWNGETQIAEERIRELKE